MKREAKSYKVSILGEHYTLLSDDTESHVVQTAAMVDALLKEITEKSGSADIKKISVLAALQLASRLVYAQTRLEQDRAQKEALVNRINQELNKVLPHTTQTL